MFVVDSSLFQKLKSIIGKSIYNIRKGSTDPDHGAIAEHVELMIVTNMLSMKHE